MSAAAAARVAQLSHGEASANTAGTGADHKRPITASTMGGTQIQCRSLLTGFWWLTPYSPSQSVTLRTRGTLPAARAPRNLRAPPGLQAAIWLSRLPRAHVLICRIRLTDTPYLTVVLFGVCLF